MPKKDVTFDNSTLPRASRRRPGQHLTKDQRIEAQEKFLCSFRNTANVRASCMVASIDRKMIYIWLEKDQEFSLQYRQAELDAADTIRGELFRRAVQGYEKPVVNLGKVVYVEEELPNGKTQKRPLMERVYSDSLLALLARARLPEFRVADKLEVSGPNGGPVQTVQIYKIRLPDNGRDTQQSAG